MEAAETDSSVIEFPLSEKFQSKRRNKKSRKRHLAALASKTKEGRSKSILSSGDNEQSSSSMETYQERWW